MTFLMTLRRMGRGDLTGHGFRSTFRDWAAERTAMPREVVEATLAHTVADKVEAAYLRRMTGWRRASGISFPWPITTWCSPCRRRSPT